jgi:hypothetical protein
MSALFLVKDNFARYGFVKVNANAAINQVT